MALKKGEIIARPSADGTYAVLVYAGRQTGWELRGVAKDETDARRMIANINRPIITG